MLGEKYNKEYNFFFQFFLIWRGIFLLISSSLRTFRSETTTTSSLMYGSLLQNIRPCYLVSPTLPIAMLSKT